MKQNAQPSPSDIMSLRYCLGQFSTGVCIITASVEGELLGMTISSFNSLSLQPSLVLFSIDRRAHGLPLWMKAKGLVIHVLSQEQQRISTRFARPSADKWEGITYAYGVEGAPVLSGVTAVFQCLPYAQHEAGDHVLFIVQIVQFEAHDQRPPLIFFQGKYNQLQHPGKTAEIWPLDIHY